MKILTFTHMSRIAILIAILSGVSSEKELSKTIGDKLKECAPEVGKYISGFENNLNASVKTLGEVENGISFADRIQECAQNFNISQNATSFFEGLQNCKDSKGSTLGKTVVEKMEALATNLTGIQINANVTSALKECVKKVKTSPSGADIGKTLGELVTAMEAKTLNDKTMGKTMENLAEAFKNMLISEQIGDTLEACARKEIGSIESKIGEAMVNLIKAVQHLSNGKTILTNIKTCSEVKDLADVEFMSGRQLEKSIIQCAEKKFNPDGKVFKAIKEVAKSFRRLKDGDQVGDKIKICANEVLHLNLGSFSDNVGFAVGNYSETVQYILYTGNEELVETLKQAVSDLKTIKNGNTQQVNQLEAIANGLKSISKGDNVIKTTLAVPEVYGKQSAALSESLGHMKEAIGKFLGSAELSGWLDHMKESNGKCSENGIPTSLGLFLALLCIIIGGGLAANAYVNYIKH